MSCKLAHHPRIVKLEKDAIYYWIVKHEGSEAQDIFSHKEAFYEFKSHHIAILSVGINIGTNSPSSLYLWGTPADSKVFLGTIVAFKKPVVETVKNPATPSPKTRRGIF